MAQQEGVWGRNAEPSERQRAAAGRTSGVPFVPLEIGSSGVVKLHQYFTFRDFADFFIRAEREKIGICWLAAHSAARQAEVRIPCDFKYLLCPIKI
jgi:hypothetical protein